MEIAKGNHILHTLHRGRVHRLDAPLGRQPLLCAVIVLHLDASSLGRYNAGSDGYIELPTRYRLDPDVVTLKRNGHEINFKVRLKSIKVCQTFMETNSHEKKTIRSYKTRICTIN